MFMESIGKLSNLQMELLKMFQYNLSDNQLKEVRKLLSGFFAENISREVDKIWNENNWNEKTIDKLKDEHLRTKYE